MVNDEAVAFHSLVYDVIREIPHARVTTYGHIAYLLGRPNNSRQVGFALKYLSSNEASNYNYLNVPWWRVINASGRVSPRPQSHLHVEKLAEEVEVSERGSVSLARYGWFPEPEEVLCLQ